jgi:hypothetical protein
VALIDEDIVKGVSMRKIAQHFGVSYDAVHRHKKEHLPELIKEAYARGLAERGASLVDRLEGHLKRCEVLLDQAESGDDKLLFLATMKEVRQQIRLLGEFTHELDNQTHVTLSLSPEWLEVRGIIVGTLEDMYPKALDALALALEESTVGVLEE